MNQTIKNGIIFWLTASIVFLMCWFVYAAWNDIVSTGDPVTATGWNEVVTKIGEIDSNLLNLSFNNGNVWIGTTTPTSKLDVAWDININGITVGKGGWDIVSNTAIGNWALFTNTTGNYNTANGYRSLYSNTTGDYNAANGYETLRYNTTGSNNTANGYNSLYSNTTGGYNTANGYRSLYSNTTGDYNTANGHDSLRSSTTGGYNTANGYASLRYNIAGTRNTANGFYSLYSNTTGNNNVADGSYALHDNIEGHLNTAIGYNTGRGITTGSNNTILGAGVTWLPATLSNNIIIADGAGNQRIRVLSNGYVWIGTSSPTHKLHVNGSARATAWNTTSDKTLKKNIVSIDSPIEKIQDMRGVYFDWKSDDSHDVWVIAQEVEMVFPEIVTTDTEWIKSVDYSKLTPVLIEAIKELKQEKDTEIEQLKTENAVLQSQNLEFENRLNILENGR